MSFGKGWEKIGYRLPRFRQTTAASIGSKGAKMPVILTQ